MLKIFLVLCEMCILCIFGGVICWAAKAVGGVVVVVVFFRRYFFRKYVTVHSCIRKYSSVTVHVRMGV